MGMGMHMIPEQRLEQSLRQKQRLKLEQTLEQQLAQQQTMCMGLQQYLDQEEFIQELIQWTNENDAWVEFNRLGFNFRFANVPYLRAAPIADTTGPGFAQPRGYPR